MTSLSMTVLSTLAGSRDCAELQNGISDECAGLLPLVGAGAVWGVAALIGVVGVIVVISVTSALPTDAIGSWFEERILGLNGLLPQTAPAGVPLPGTLPPSEAPTPGVPTEPQVAPPDVPAPGAPLTPGVDVPPGADPPPEVAPLPPWVRGPGGPRPPWVDLPPRQPGRPVGVPPDVTPPGEPELDPPGDAPPVEFPPSTEPPPEVMPPGTDAPPDVRPLPDVDPPARPDAPGIDLPEGPDTPAPTPAGVPGRPGPGTPDPGHLPGDPRPPILEAHDAGDDAADPGEDGEPDAQGDMPEEWLALDEDAKFLAGVRSENLTDARQVVVAVQELWNGSRDDAELLLDLVLDALDVYDQDLGRALDAAMQRMIDNPMLLHDRPDVAGVRDTKRDVLGRFAELNTAYEQMKEKAEAVLEAYTVHATTIDVMAEAMEARKTLARAAVDFANEVKAFNADILDLVSGSVRRAARWGDFEFGSRKIADFAEDITGLDPGRTPSPDHGQLPPPAGSDLGSINGMILAAILIIEVIKRKFGKG